MASNRIKKNNAEAVSAYFAARGVAVTITTPSRQLMGGCGIAPCCGAHPGVTNDGEPMVSVVGVTGGQLHRALVDLGLVLA